MTGTISKPTTYPKRGEVYLVSFDPTIGAEIKKTRPALIIQNNIGNQYADTTIVAAITSKTSKRSIPVSVYLRQDQGGLNKDSYLLLSQLRTIDKRRLGKRLGLLTSTTMNRVDQEIKVSLYLR